MSPRKSFRPSRRLSHAASITRALIVRCRKRNSKSVCFGRLPSLRGWRQHRSAGCRDNNRTSTILSQWWYDKSKVDLWLTFQADHSYQSVDQQGIARWRSDGGRIDVMRCTVAVTSVNTVTYRLAPFRHNIALLHIFTSALLMDSSCSEHSSLTPKRDDWWRRLAIDLVTSHAERLVPYSTLDTQEAKPRARVDDNTCKPPITTRASVSIHFGPICAASAINHDPAPRPVQPNCPSPLTIKTRRRAGGVWPEINNYFDALGAL